MTGTPRALVLQAVDAVRPLLAEVVHALHADPELSFAEHRAVARLSAVLEGQGVAVETGVHDLSTAFRAVAGSGPFEVVLCAEYDALPEIGHACAHNVIAAGALGAMIALAPLADMLGVRVVLLGTPAEEHGAGKQLMLERGAWDTATVSLMVHPSSGPDRWPDRVDRSAVHRLRATFRGRASHAAAAPEKGVNAGDAAALSLVAIGMLRQQVPDGMRLSAFIREAGVATNIIPALSVVDFEVRGPDVEAEAAVEARVRDCFQGAAIATGCTVEITETEPLYEQVEQDAGLTLLFAEAMAQIGRPLDPADQPVPGGSTDMGNVSRYVPSLHPTVSIRGTDASLHTAEFAAAASTSEAVDAAVDSAKAMALTVVALAADAPLRERYLAAQVSRPPYAASR
ncbi:M20 family metallopeptidase [Ornithinimicrobium pratense]|nr:M20 family metallopeptidase [Ornithinimicrobium pratense]